MNIRIFGEAEERAVDQLKRCLSVEEGSRGVLCADNHVGYSQPIGGAVAYRDHISPSGVGYDIGFLAAQGDTIRVLHTLTPVGVAMAGADTFDPFKD
mgnify:CR=1 FL=1